MISKHFGYLFPAFTAALILLSLSGCSSTAQLPSNWNNSEMKIDGDFSDWENSLHAIKDEGVSLGFKNDDKNLYICLLTTDRGKMMQMMRSGFIVWFYPENGDGKVFGIKYPMPVSMLNMDDNERQNFNRELFQPEKMNDMFTKMLERKTEFQIINEDNFPLGQYSLQNKEGIKAKLGYKEDRFIYELQVPLETAKKYTYQIASLPGEKLKIKFETLESQFGNLRGGNIGMGRGMRPGVGERGEGEGEDEGQRPEGGMKRGEGGRFSRPEPFNYQVEIQLQQQQK